jgi:hypothetical protein
MKQLLALIIGIPLAAAVAIATSLPIMLAIGFLLLFAFSVTPISNQAA